MLIGEHVDPRAVAVARVGVGLAVVLNAYESGRVVARVATGAVAVPTVVPIPSPTVALVVLWWSAATVAGVLLVLGLFGPLSAAAAATTGAIMLAWDSQAYSNHLLLTTLLSLYLVAARCDSAWSLRARFRGRRSDSTPAWPAVLMVSQLSVCYLFAALSKVNAHFLSGRVLVEEVRWELPAALLQTMAPAAVVVELSIAALLWVPRFRWLAAAAGLGLHLSIVAVLRDPVPLTSFAVVCLSVYPVAFALRPAEASPLPLISTPVPRAA